MMMKRIIPLVAFVVVIFGIVYGFQTLQGSSTNASEPIAEVPTTGGETLNLTAEEANLTVGKGEKKAVFSDLGMVCTNCQASMRAILKETDGVKVSFVNLNQNRATVVFDPKIVSTDEIKKRITDIGFRVGNIKEVAR
jgi:copper chaperone CopZ